MTLLERCCETPRRLDPRRFERDPAGSGDPEPGRDAPGAREPGLVIVGVSLLVASAAICVGLLLPVLWTIATEGGRRPIATYEQCGQLREQSRRLACFDDVLRRTSPAAAKHLSG